MYAFSFERLRDFMVFKTASIASLCTLLSNQVGKKNKVIYSMSRDEYNQQTQIVLSEIMTYHGSEDKGDDISNTRSTICFFSL